MEKQIAARFNVLPSRQKIMINPYIFDTGLKYEAFIAPLDFDPDAQELNIIKVFDKYDDVNKKYIFSVGNSAETVLPSVSGTSYAYKQNDDVYTIIESGTVTWDTGSTKRHVVVIDSVRTSIFAPISSVWVHFSDLCTDISSEWNNFSLKHITCNENNITTLGSYAFRSCSNLSGILNIKKISITSLEEFFSCNSLTEVLFSDTINAIGIRTFYQCAGLLSILIPDSVTAIGGGSFSQCSSMLNIKIPSGANVSNEAFFNCINASFNDDDLILSNQISDLYYTFCNCKKLKSINLTGSSLSSIGEGSFAGCESLYRIYIPSSVNSIGNIAFAACYSLSLIYNMSAVPQNLVGDPFSGVSKSTCVLHVPIGSVSAYQAAAGWSEFTNIIGDL